MKKRDLQHRNSKIKTEIISVPIMKAGIKSDFILKRKKKTTVYIEFDTFNLYNIPRLLNKHKFTIRAVVS